MSKLAFFPDRWMGRGFCTPSTSTPDTFLLPRRQVLWPQLATASSGTWAWSASTSKVFGGVFENSSAASGDYVEFANVPLFGAGASVNLLYTKSSTGGIVKIFWNGSQLGTIDTYNASTTHNNTATVSLGTVSANRGTLRFISDTKHASSSGYRISIQQAEITQPTGSNLGTSIDDLPWFGDAPPIFAICEYWNGSAWVVHTPAPVQDTSAMWGSYIPLAHANQWRATIRFWSPQGTHNLNLRHLAGTSGGSITATLNGAATTPGTFSTSAGSTTYNNSTNLTYTAATTGMQELVLSGSGGVACSVQWISWRKSSALGAIPGTGATYGVESLELYPWFANLTGTWNFSVDSNRLHYATFYSAESAGQQESWPVGVKPGTYSLGAIKFTNNGYQTSKITENNGATLATMNWYSAANVYNARDFVSVPITTGPMEITTLGAWRQNSTLFRLTRTGA